MPLQKGCNFVAIWPAELDRFAGTTPTFVLRVSDEARVALSFSPGPESGIRAQQGKGAEEEREDVGYSSGDYSTRGRYTVKIEPLPTWLSTVMRPLCARTIQSTMASPNPLPPDIRERAESVR